MSDNINNDQGQGNTEYDAGHKDNDILSKRSKTLDHYITKLAALREKSFSRYHVLLPEVIKELKHQKLALKVGDRVDFRNKGGAAITALGTSAKGRTVVEYRRSAAKS